LSTCHRRGRIDIGKAQFEVSFVVNMILHPVKHGEFSADDFPTPGLLSFVDASQASAAFPFNFPLILS
jgi:hypothetical protein